MRGRFITFEGGEGTGKSSHASLLARRLEALGIEVVLTREPGGSTGAEIIRHVILSGAAKPFGPAAEAILFAAARDDHLNQTIRPALARGAWVICDRFTDSTVVYQGILGGVDLNLIKAIERIVVGDDKPDLTIVLDVPPELGLQRAASRRGTGAADRFEAEAIQYHTKLREAFRALAAKDRGRCVLIDTTLPREQVADGIWNEVQSRLTPQKYRGTFREAAS
ncbi:MAG: dTMP kinase [Rhizobiales bacterium]|nr:dTMP kinase [Hyphomicrobiales bacterium]